MKRDVLAGSCLALWLCGCSTLSGDFHQKLQIDALDAQNRPVDGMQCRVGSDASAKTFVTPATEVRIRRSAMPLAIECQRDNLVATATVSPRRERMEEALLPFGSVGVVVDHLSGSLYSYPTTLHLRVGQHLVLEHGGDAQVVKSEAIAAPVAQSAAPRAAQHADLTALAPTATGGPPAAAASARAAALTGPKTDRATARAAKGSAPMTTATATATAKAKPAAAPKPALATAAAATAVPATAMVVPAPVRSAPVNW
jgi:hypothetical protein